MNGERVAGGLRCGEVLERLDAFLDGTLGPDERAMVVAHVSECAQCERFGSTYAEVTRRIRAAAEPPAEPSALLERLRAALALPE